MRYRGHDVAELARTRARSRTWPSCCGPVSFRRTRSLAGAVAGRSPPGPSCRRHRRVQSAGRRWRRWHCAVRAPAMATPTPPPRPGDALVDPGAARRRRSGDVASRSPPASAADLEPPTAEHDDARRRHRSRPRAARRPRAGHQHAGRSGGRLDSHGPVPRVRRRPGRAPGRAARRRSLGLVHELLVECEEYGADRRGPPAAGKGTAPRFRPLASTAARIPACGRCSRRCRCCPTRPGRRDVVDDLLIEAGIRLTRQANVDLGLGALCYVGGLPADLAAVRRCPPRRLRRPLRRGAGRAPVALPRPRARRWLSPNRARSQLRARRRGR